MHTNITAKTILTVHDRALSRARASLGVEQSFALLGASFAESEALAQLIH